MKRFLLLVVAALFAGTWADAQVTTFPYTQGFENGLDGWTVLDLDGDGHNWTVADINDPADDHAFDFAANSGTKYIYSGSYMRYSPNLNLYPDNLLISPAITVVPGLILKYHYRSNGSDGVEYGHEHMGVYISTTGGNVSDILATPPTEDFTLTDEESMEYHTRTISLADYAGQTIHIAFRHYNCYEEFELYLDDIYIGAPREPEVTLEPETEVNINTNLHITAHYTGSTDGLQFQWSSQMAQAGDAVLTWVDQVATIAYSVAGTDTVRVIAVNNYGADTAYMEVRALTIAPVSEFPFTFDFENYVPGAGYANDINGWHVGTATASTGTHSIYISYDGGQTNAYDIYTPSISYAARYFQFNEAGTYTYGYDWRCRAEPGFDYMRVFLAPSSVVFNPDSYPVGMSTGDGALPLGMSDLGGVLAGQENWTRQEGTFEVETAGLYKIVFMWVNDGSMGYQPAAAIDNFYLNITSCAAPSGLTLDSLGADFIAVHWTPGGNESQWIVSVNDTASVTVSSPSLLLSGLSAMSSYHLRVSALCNSGDTSLSVQGTWSTPCTPITANLLPYTEDFEDFSSADCWHMYSYLYGVRNTNFPTINSYGTAHSGSNTMQLYGFESQPCYLVLPYVQDFTNLRLKFWLYSYEIEYPIKVGVMTDPDDTATFVTLESVYNLVAEQWQEVEVPLNGYTGTGRYVAIRTGGNYSDYFIDDIDIDFQPVCPRPAALRISDVTDSTANLVIVDPAEVGNYKVILSTLFHTDTLYTADTVVHLTGLDIAAHYTVEVTTLCADGTVTPPTTSSFITVMVAAELPYSTGFEEGQDRAWLTVNGHNGWYVGDATSSTGARSLYISANEGATSTYDVNRPSTSYAARSFHVSQAGDLVYAYDWRSMGEASFDYMRAWIALGEPTLTAGMPPMGISNTRTDNPGDWTDIGGGEMGQHNTWQHINGVYTASDTGIYTLVFMWRNDNTVGTAPAGIIDNVVVHPLLCEGPGPIVVDSTGIDFIAFHWGAANPNGEWVVTVGNTSYTTHTPSFSLNGLNPSTLYPVSVASICFGTDTSIALHQNIRTNMVPATLPYATGFEPGDDRGWVISTAVNQWVIDTAEHYDGQYALYISKDHGQTASYETGSTSVCYATRLLEIDSAGAIDYSYVWKGVGEGCCDFMRIWLVPGAYAPEDGQLPSGLNYDYTGSPAGWIDLGNDLMNNNAFWELRSGDVIIPAAGLYTLVVMWYNDFSQGIYPAAVLDNIALGFSTCSTPRSLTFDSVGPHALSLHWSRSGSESRWLVTCEGDTLVTTDTTAFLAPLNAAHHYEVFVRALCDNGDTSMAISGKAITGCDNVNLPFEENFMYIHSGSILSGGQLPCWNMYSGSYSTLTGTADLQPATFDVFEYSHYALGGKAHVKVNIYGTVSRWLVTPPIILDAYANLSFHYALTSYSSPNPISQSQSVADDHFFVLVSSDGGAHWSPVLTWGTGPGYDFDYASVSSTNDSVSVSLAGFAGDTVRIAFYGVSVSMGGDNDFHIGDIVVAADPNMPDVCTAPAIHDTLVTPQSIKVDFAGAVAEYQVGISTGEWSEDAELVSVQDTTFTFTRLRANTRYTIGIRSVCSDSVYSSWALLPVVTAPAEQIPCSTPEDLLLTNADFSSATFTWTPVGAESVWDIHVVGASEDTIYTVTTIPATVDGLYSNTTYSATVRARCSATRYSDWSTPTYFSTLLCEAVAMLAVDQSSISETQATLNWTPAQNSTGNYEIEYGRTGFVQGAGTMATVFGATTKTLTGLDPNTTYDVYVRSICSEGIRSLWSQPVYFTTSTQGIFNADNNNLSLHPNPATDCVTLDGIEGTAEIQIFDLHGNVVESHEVTGPSFTFDVSELPAGAYFVSIVGDQVRSIRKLIVR